MVQHAGCWRTLGETAHQWTARLRRQASQRAFASEDERRFRRVARRPASGLEHEKCVRHSRSRCRAIGPIPGARTFHRGRYPRLCITAKSRHSNATPQAACRLPGVPCDAPTNASHTKVGSHCRRASPAGSGGKCEPRRSVDQSRHAERCGVVAPRASIIATNARAAGDSAARLRIATTRRRRTSSPSRLTIRSFSASA